jgi:hypothetical protein
VPLGGCVAGGLYSNVFGDANALIRRTAFEAAGGFSEAYGLGLEDWELFAKLALAGVRFDVVATPLLWYRQSPGGMLLASVNRPAELRRAATGYLAAVPAALVPALLLAQGETYRGEFLRGEVQAAGTLLEQRLRAMGEMEEMIRDRDRAIADQAAMIDERDRTIADQAAMIDERDRTIADQAAMIDERDRTIAAQAAMVEERWTAMQEMGGEIAGRDRFIDELKAAVAGRDAVIQAQAEKMERMLCTRVARALRRLGLRR